MGNPEGDFDRRAQHGFLELHIVVEDQLGQALVGHDRQGAIAPGLVNQLGEVVPRQTVELIGHQPPHRGIVLHAPGEDRVEKHRQDEIGQELRLGLGQAGGKVTYHQVARIQPLLQVNGARGLRDHEAHLRVGQKFLQARDGAVHCLSTDIGGRLLGVIEAVKVLAEFHWNLRV